MYYPSLLYNTIPGVALGEEEVELLPPAPQGNRLCFNCGSPNHAVSSCPEPIDRQLVSLSCQLFKFLHPDPIGQVFTRFHVAEGWKQQRLEWLTSYKPGVIRGPLLRDALGLQEGDPGNEVEWLRNMAYWGYPPGWVGHRDPIELVCRRILGDEGEEQFATTDCRSLTIFDGLDHDEEIDLGPFGPSIVAATTSFDEERWATYSDTYFSSTALSIYNGTPLDMVVSSPPRVSVTFTAERRVLWERILSGGLGTSHNSSAPPWRIPGAFGASTLEGGLENITPPPPSTTPPPLPPSSPFISHTCLELNRESTLSLTFNGMHDVVGDPGSPVDMDVSEDSDSE